MNNLIAFWPIAAAVIALIIFFAVKTKKSNTSQPSQPSQPTGHVTIIPPVVQPPVEQTAQNTKAVLVAPQLSTTTTDTSFPKIIDVDGIKVMAFEPINPLWRASLLGHVMCKGGAAYVFDPSNGGLCKPPMPRRSPAGYPLLYGIGEGGAAVGDPKIVFGDMSFDTDAEIAGFLAQEPARLAAGTAAAEAAAARVLNGPVPFSSLTREDWIAAWAYLDRPGHGGWIDATLSGPWSEIREQLSIIGNNPSQWIKFNFNTYTGILKQYMK